MEILVFLRRLSSKCIRQETFIEWNVPLCRLRFFVTNYLSLLDISVAAKWFNLKASILLQVRTSSRAAHLDASLSSFSRHACMLSMSVSKVTGYLCMSCLLSKFFYKKYLRQEYGGCALYFLDPRINIAYSSTKTATR